MPLVTCAQLKDYLSAPADMDANCLAIYLNAALSEADAAGVPRFSNNAMYDIFILALASWHYDNRGMQVSGTYQTTALETKRNIMNSFVLELRHASEDPTEEGGEDDE